MKSYEIDDNMIEILNRDGGCQHPNCGQYDWSFLQIAHRISKGKTGQRFMQNYAFRQHGLELTQKFIKDKMIHHPFNIVTSCAEHNDYFNCLNKPEIARGLVDRILVDLNLIKEL